jgi:hypothetical protein
MGAACAASTALRASAKGTPVSGGALERASVSSFAGRSRLKVIIGSLSLHEFEDRSVDISRQHGPRRTAGSPKASSRF